MNKTSFSFLFLLIMIFASEVFRETGISFLVTKYESNFNEEIEVINELYFDERKSIRVKNVVFELGEEYYISHKSIDLNKLLKRNQLRSLKNIVENDDVQIIKKHQDKSLAKINKELVKIKQDQGVPPENKGCDFKELQSKRERNFFYCNVDSYFSSFDGIPQEIFIEVCVDLISFWKKNDKELVYSLPKNDWMIINFQERNEISITHLMDSCDDSITLIPDEFLFYEETPITFQNLFYLN